jgi:predicted nucleotidyltransferase
MKRSSNATKSINDERFSQLLAENGQIVTTIVSALPDTLAIYAFGSRIQDNANFDSDLDLAVLVAGYAGPLELWGLSGTLAELVGCEVDLLDMRTASTVMQYQILTTGIRLWGRELQAGLFESYVLSEKTALDTARASLLADIKQRGNIYAR